MTDDKKALALFKAYVDASDQELVDWGVDRGDILWMARQYILTERDEELSELADTLIKERRNKAILSAYSRPPLEFEDVFGFKLF